ncbi:MAG: transposase zinc-binding domain-containing protein [Bryobacteraceae bacterium]|nr:transposase zinc-binding domain-containing protein [Bryobacteraceae bacterium]
MAQLTAGRTAALAGHAWQCEACGAVRADYNSRGNRHCPTCRGAAREVAPAGAGRSLAGALLPCGADAAPRAVTRPLPAPATTRSVSFNGRHEPRASARRLHAFVRCRIGPRLAVRQKHVLEHGTMPRVERHPWNLPLRRRCGDEGIC